MKLRKILVATDFTPCSEPAVEAALDLGRAEGAGVTLFHVCEPPPFSTPDLAMYTPSPELTADIIAATQRTLEERRARYAGKGVPVDTAWAMGAPAPGIVGYATAQDFDLIVVGSHGRRGFRRLVLGSVAESVVRLADRPVLTIHADAATPATAGAA